MSILKKEDFWNVTRQMPAEAVEVHDANGAIVGRMHMRGLSGRELTEYQNSLTILLNSGQAMSKLVALCAINEDGSPYFEKHEISQLDDAPARVLIPLFESAQRLCGLTDDDFREMTEGFGETENEPSASD
jgi:hypothetical protein